jgi:hypothetical protein
MVENGRRSLMSYVNNLHVHPASTNEVDDFGCDL